MSYKSAQILIAVLSLRPGVRLWEDFELADVGEGPFISKWYRVDMTKPTKAEIEAVDTDALLARDISVTRVQFRKMLRGSARAPAFFTYINGASAEIQDYWELELEFRRTDAEIEELRVALGLTNNQMDNAFTTAKTFTRGQ